MAGYELACDALVAFIEDEPTDERVRDMNARIVACANARQALPSPYIRGTDDYERLTDLYYDHIRDSCPVA